MHVFPSQRLNEDVVQSTLTELILLLLFFFLILLGSFVSINGAQNDASKADRDRLSAILETQESLRRDAEERLSVATSENSDLKFRNDELERRLGEVETLLSFMGEKRASDGYLRNRPTGEIADLSGDFRLIVGKLNKQRSKLQIALLSEKGDNAALRARVGQLDAWLSALGGKFYQTSQSNVKKDEQHEIELAQEKLTNWLLRFRFGVYQLKLALLERRIKRLEKKNLAQKNLISTVVRTRESFSEASKLTWPASLVLADNNGYRFRSGSAELTDQFLLAFETDARQKLAKILANTQFDIRTIEVIGHTDEETRRSDLHTSNLDLSLIEFLDQGDAINSADDLRSVDNAGLGMARATAVAALIRQRMDLPIDLRVIPLSAAQMVEIDGNVATGPVEDFSNDARRRIEIRVRGPEMWTQ